MENLKSPHDKAVSEILLIDQEVLKKNPKKLIKQKEIQLTGAERRP